MLLTSACSLVFTLIWTQAALTYQITTFGRCFLVVWGFFHKWSMKFWHELKMGFYTTTWQLIYFEMVIQVLTEIRHWKDMPNQTTKAYETKAYFINPVQTQVTAVSITALRKLQAFSPNPQTPVEFYTDLGYFCPLIKSFCLTFYTLPWRKSSGMCSEESM